jgi:hypothetical protein
MSLHVTNFMGAINRNIRASIVVNLKLFRPEAFAVVLQHMTICHTLVPLEVRRVLGAGADANGGEAMVIHGMSLCR